MEQRCHQRRCEMPRKPLNGSGVFRHEFAGILRQLEYLAKRHAIVSKQVFAGLRIRDTDADIDQDRIRRTSSAGIEDDRDGIVIQDLPRNYNIAGIFRRDFEMRPPDEFPPDFFRKLLLHTVRCRSVRESGNSHCTARTFLQLRAGQPVTASAQEQTAKDDQSSHNDV